MVKKRSRTAPVKTLDAALVAQAAEPIAPIRHMFVLMLENRSFDHLFAFSGLPGVAPPPARFGFAPGATDRLTSDPPHEYDDVAAQVAGGAMTGFLQSGGPQAMRGFAAGNLPFLSALAAEGLLFDNWYSSMPGPTWPNRFFAHAASSGGLDNSPSGFTVGQAVSSPNYSFQFDGGHIFDRLTREGRSWRIYRGDTFPQVLALRGMVDKRVDRAYFRPYGDFTDDMQQPYDADYTFIEPSYDPLLNYANGTSQHPLGSVAAGEALIREVYRAIFSGPSGPASALLVVWDEHGGFFDHVPPPAAVPPGDSPNNYKRAAQPRDCKFDRLGPRVPAILVSPWFPQGLGSQEFAGQNFDHASIVHSLRMTFGLKEPLTKRDASATSWYTALLPEPRSLSLDLPQASASQALQAAPMSTGVNLLGTLQLASKLDWDLAGRMGVKPLLASPSNAAINAIDTSTGAAADGSLSLEQRQVIVDYAGAVQKREDAYLKSQSAGAQAKQ